MDRLQVTEWTAKTVEAVTKKKNTSVSKLAEDTGIAYATLWRKLHSKGNAPFNWAELLSIAEALSVEPALFTPPIFRKEKSDVGVR